MKRKSTRGQRRVRKTNGKGIQAGGLSASGTSANGSMRKIIVIGGSSGGIKSLCRVLERLPADLPAPVLAVIHMFEGTSRLPAVLQRCGPLEVVAPQPAEPLLPGRVYLPRPNHHLLVRENCVVTVMGPRESRHRPSVNTLFRCVARTYRTDVVAVVLSGSLDDGTAGAMAVKARGGTVIVEDPATAEAPQMPDNVMKVLTPDYCAPAQEIPRILKELVAKGRVLQTQRGVTREQCLAQAESVRREREPQGISCPECGGVLSKLGEGEASEYRCHVGHTFSLQSLTEAHADALERALWVAVRKLNEQRSIHTNLATIQTNPDLKRRFKENAAAAENDIAMLHEILSRL